MKRHGKWLAGVLCFSLLAPSVSWADLDVEKIRQDYERQGYKLEGVSDEEIASMVESVVDALKDDSTVNKGNFDEKLIKKSLEIIDEHPNLKNSVLKQVSPADLKKILDGQVPDNFKPIRDAIYSEYRASAPGSGGGGAGGGSGGLVQQPQPEGLKNGQIGTETAAFAADAFKKLEKSSNLVTISFDRERLLHAVKDLQEVKLISLSVEEFSQAETVRVAFDTELLQGIQAAHPQAVIRIDAGDAELDLPLAEYSGEQPEVPGLGVQVEIEAKKAEQVTQVINKLAHGKIVVSPVSIRVDGLRLKGMSNGQNALSDGKSRGILLRIPVEEKQVEDLTLLVWDKAAEEWRFVPAAVVKEQDRTLLQTKRFIPGMYAVVRVDVAFADIQSHWAREEIETLAKKYLVHGVEPEKFQPDVPVTRAQFVSLIARLLQQVETGQTGLPWNDVSPDDWYASSLRSAYVAGLVKGELNGNFLSNKRISREEMAAILDRLLAYLEEGNNPLGQGDTGPTGGGANAATLFPDAQDISPWAKEAVRRVVAEGLMKGTNRGFEPKKATTRAEATAVIHRLLKKLDWIE